MSIPYEYPFPDQDYEVLVVSYTYNHEKYIEQTLKGIVMQQTNFKFVALILDDCSTDGTAEIIRNYEARYPDLIKGIYEPENYFSQGKSQEEYIQPWRDRSKYQAFCEGDDYWTDPMKLQKQYDFMESHPDCTLSFHNVIEHWEDEREKDKVASDVRARVYTADEIRTLEHWMIATCSVMFRTEISRSEKVVDIFTHYRFFYYDIILFYCCAIEGNLYGIEDVMGVYRRVNSGITLQVKRRFVEDQECIDCYCNHYLTISEVFSNYFGKKFKRVIDDMYMYQLCKLSIFSLLHLNFVKSFSLLKKSFLYSFLGTLRMALKLVWNLIRKYSSLLIGL